MDIWRLTEERVYEELRTSPRGLSSEEARTRLGQHGANVLPEKAGRPLIYRFGAQFTQLFAILLEVAAALVFIAAMLSRGPDRQDYINVTIAIVGVVILNATIGFFQEYRAEKATEALRKLVPPTAKVVRDGEVTVIPAADLVPGDVAVLEEGDAISADARLVRQYEMATNNVALTGESDPVRKTADAILEEDIAPINMPNMVFMGSSVSSGNGRGVIVATGLSTEFGRIFTLTTSVKEEKSPLQISIDRMARLVSIIAIFFGVALFVMGRVLGLQWVGAVLFAMGVFVCFVPEGLPATLSVALAVGVQRMARNNALIKKLSAVETLGSTNVICTDKTGTLTKAEMTVKEIWLAGLPLEVTGAGYEPQGEFHTDGRALSQDEAARVLERLNRAMTFCNDAKVLPPQEGKGWRVIGDPTEGCLLVAAQKAGFDLQRELIKRPKIYELPFDSVRKRMSVVHADETVGQVAFAKGAPGETIARCTRLRVDGKVVSLDDELRAQVLAQNDAMARAALRVLAVCERELPADLTDYRPDTIETDLTLIGLAGMIDPPRPEVAAAVEHALSAGIRIIMVTGDYGLTAEAIARRIGIVRGERSVRVVTGTELDRTGEGQLKEILAQPLDLLFARVAPEHKMRVVAALKDMGAIVAVTGDGVNDAPALKRADIGVAMGLTGTDVSREAATMILLDDSFASIIKAVEQGRGVYANIKKMVTYIFSHNMAELFPYVFATFGGLHLVPLTALQILSIDLGSDVLPGLSLGVEQPEPGVMKRPPRPKSERLMTRGTIGRIGFIGAIQSITAVGGFLYVLLSHGWHWGDASWAVPGNPNFKYYAEAITMTQAAIVVSQFFNGFACRTESESLFEVGIFKNRALVLSEIFGVAILVAISYAPPLQSLFKTGPLSLVDWAFVVAGGVALFVAEEARKWVERRRAARRGEGEPKDPVARRGAARLGREA